MPSPTEVPDPRGPVGVPPPMENPDGPALSNGRVNLMFDNDVPGVEGAREALWMFAKRWLDVRLVWSPAMHSGAFNARQPESLTLVDAEILPYLTCQQPSMSETA